MDEHIALAVIGGGPAGMAAAIAAKESGIEEVVIYERDAQLGGILNQCIHNGFGLHTFGEELTGPEYADRYLSKVKALDIRCETNSMVLSISPDRDITVVSSSRGLRVIHADAIVLAMGCRERPRGALNIPGTRPQGIYTAGTAQKLVNCMGQIPGREVAILGSGDIGLIMARRMTLEGAHVQVVAELMPYSGGLKRNIVQCLDDFGIPLKLSHTVVNIHGKRKLEGITIAAVDEHNLPIPGTEAYYACDTLLLSCGLIPENELSLTAGIDINPITNGPRVSDDLETSIPGIFSCGNALHVHDLVDFVSEEASRAGENASRYIRSGRGGEKSCRRIRVVVGGGVRYTVPSSIDADGPNEAVHIRFRVNNVYKGCSIQVRLDDRVIFTKRRRIMVPSEMEDIALERAQLREGDITVEIVGDGV